MTLNAENQPVFAEMTGGVRYGSDEPLRKAQGEASEGTVAFEKGHPEHVTMTGPVHCMSVCGPRTRPANLERAGSERGVLELALATDSAGRSLLRDAKATGDARLKVTSAAAKGGISGRSSSFSGDVLTARFVRIGSVDHIAEVHGDGHTALRKMDAAGKVDTSSGDSLVADFQARDLSDGRRRSSSRGQSAKKEELGGQGGDEISDATLQGHVVITQVPAKKPGDAVAPAEQRATAERAVYDGRRIGP